MSVKQLTLPSALERATTAIPRPGWPGAGRALLVGSLTVFLSFRAGGFHAGITGIAALVLSFGLVLRVTTARNPFAGWSAGLAVCAGAVALLGAWMLTSV